MQYTTFRPVRSDTDDHTNRPPMLKMLSNPANPPPTTADTPNMFCSMSLANPSTPIPALTFMHKTTHNSQNCGVRHARSTETLAVVTSFDSVSFGTQPSGFHPAAGTRTINAPNSMNPL